MRKFLMLLGGLLALAIVFVIARSNAEAWTEVELNAVVAQLNEAAAIGVPHDYLLEDGLRKTNAALLAKVEKGELLNAVESAEYRKVFQAILLSGQKFLGRFDRELSVLHDHALLVPNNIGNLGIQGDHDHHDLSARKNFADLLFALDALRNAKTAWSRIRFANVAQKDLVDLISHLGVAPHTVSVPYAPPEVAWSDAALGQQFEAMTIQYKAAQHADVHSEDYWRAIDAATKSYVALILAVQDQIWANTSNWERKIAGRFNAIQTLAPPVDLARTLRR